MVAQDGNSKSNEFRISIDDITCIDNEKDKFLDDKGNQSSHTSSLDCILSQILKMNISEIGDYELNSEYLKSFSDDVNQDVSVEGIVQGNDFEGNILTNLPHEGTSFQNKEISTAYKWERLTGTKSNDHCAYTKILNKSEPIHGSYDDVGNSLLFDDYRSSTRQTQRKRQIDNKDYQELPAENIKCSNKINSAMGETFEQSINVENNVDNSSISVSIESSSVNKDKDKFFSILWSIIDNDPKHPIQFDDDLSISSLSISKDSKDNQDRNNLKSQEKFGNDNPLTQPFQNEEENNLDSTLRSTAEENGLYFSEVVNNLPSWKSFIAYVRGDVDRNRDL